MAEGPSFTHKGGFMAGPPAYCPARFPSAVEWPSFEKQQGSLPNKHSKPRNSGDLKFLLSPFTTSSHPHPRFNSVFAQAVILNTDSI